MTYIRGSKVIVLKPGNRGEDHAGEGFEAGGEGELELLPQGDEITLYRIVIPEHLPVTLMAGLAGRKVRELVTIPPWKGFCPVHGNDHAGDALHLIRNAQIVDARPVGRGTLIAVEDNAATIRLPEEDGAPRRGCRCANIPGT